jgi:hypothetical protein
MTAFENKLGGFNLNGTVIPMTQSDIRWETLFLLNDHGQIMFS